MTVVKIFLRTCFTKTVGTFCNNGIFEITVAHTTSQISLIKNKTNKIYKQCKLLAAVPNQIE